MNSAVGGSKLFISFSLVCCFSINNLRFLFHAFLHKMHMRKMLVIPYSGVCSIIYKLLNDSNQVINYLKFYCLCSLVKENMQPTCITQPCVMLQMGTFSSPKISCVQFSPRLISNSIFSLLLKIKRGRKKFHAFLFAIVGYKYTQTKIYLRRCFPDLYGITAVA